MFIKAAYVSSDKVFSLFNLFEVLVPAAVGLVVESFFIVATELSLKFGV
jgi:hypothetical protein